MAANASAPLSCPESPVGTAMGSAFIGTKLLVAPVALLVLCLGLRRRRRSLSDTLTFHSAAMELLFALGAALHLCGLAAGLAAVRAAGTLAGAALLFGQTCFHVLTCVDRYLAVARPVAYVRLSRSVWMRSVSAGCVWLLYAGWAGVMLWYYPNVAYVPYLMFLTLALVAVSFCSLSALRVLVRPGPGSGRDQAKRRAFSTIAAVTAVLWLGFLLNIAALALYSSDTLTFTGQCVLLAFGNFASLPSSLVLPLLFLHKAGKKLC